MDPVPQSTPRQWGFSQTMPRLLGGYTHVKAPPPDDERPRLTERSYSIPRKPVPKPSAVSITEQSSVYSSTSAASDDDSNCKTGSELHGDSVWYLAFSVVAALVPFVFVALAIITARLDGKPISPWGDKVEKAILLVPTVYPVIFAALVSKFLRSLALDLAARGTTLGKLEQLMGSGTVGGAITTAFLLRFLNITTLLLITLWALSPLGGQAALRMLNVRTEMTARSTADIWYLSSDSEPWIVGASALSRVRPRVDAAYMTSILAPINSRSEPWDIYGKIKIPWIEPMEEASKPLDDGWFAVNQANVLYSSLIGVPFHIIPEANESATGSFAMETSYFNFDCEQVLKFNEHTVPKTIFANLHSNTTSGGSFRSMLLNLTEAGYASGRMGDRTGVLEPRKVDFISRLDTVYDRDTRKTTRYFSYGQCSMATTYVESNVTCTDARCKVTAVRRSRRPHAPEHLSILDGAGTAINHNLYNSFSLAGAGGNSDMVTPSERYLSNREDAWALLSTLQQPPDIPAVDKAIFSQRLGTLFNTYWIAFQAPLTVTTAPQNLSIIDKSTDASSSLPSHISSLAGSIKPFNETASPFLAEKTSATFIRSEPRYSCVWYWLTCFGCSAVMLAVVSLLGVVCQFLRIAPDIFWVSGLVRDTPYIRVEGDAGMSTIGGCNKAYLVKNIKVMVADVEPDNEVGKVALVAIDRNMGEKAKGWNRLQWRRRYR